VSYIDGGTCPYTPNCMMHSGERRVPLDVRRGSRGNYITILTDADVHELRKRYDAGEKRDKIAKDFGVSYATVQDIGKRRTWKWVS
jgi:helix-turn-helix resolvase-like protein